MPGQVISGLRKKERNGLIELPKAGGLRRGDRVRIKSGPFAGRLGLYAGQRPHERVAELLGSERQVELARADVEALPLG